MRLQQVYSMVIHCNFSMGFCVYIVSEHIANLGNSRGFCYFLRGVRNEYGRFGLADTTKSGSFPQGLNILGSSVFLAQRGENDGSLRAGWALDGLHFF